MTQLTRADCFPGQARRVPDVDRCESASASLALEAVGVCHRVFGHLNVAAFLGPHKGSLIRNAHRRKVERLMRLQFAGLLTMSDRLIELSLQRVDSAEGQVS